MSLHGDKGSRYVAQLYEARSNGMWQEVPELARKVEKHAPARRTLTLTARAGAAVYQNKEGYQAAENQYGAALTASLEHEETHRDILDGLVMRAAMCYGTGQYELALRQIPETLHRSPAPNGVKGENVWFATCVLQGILIRGLSLEALGDLVGAGNTYRSIIAYVSRVVALRSKYVELCRWTEELLSHMCIFFIMEHDNKPLQLGEAMAAFHLLSRFLDDQAWRPLGTRGSFAGHRPRAVWRAFYEALTRIVVEGLVYHPSPVQRDHDTPEHRGLLEEDDFVAARMQQRADLRRVEANYESLLLQETQFPKANETNEEIKTWVELVMSNFRTLCGPTWTDAELGHGGKAAVGRTTLDILYRAATKTFHSTQILRHLFQIHAFLGEFNLAYKALDSYIEIITKGKARVERSGSAGLDLDDDDTAVRLLAEAIRVACKYGPDADAEKVLGLGNTLQKWLEKISSNALINTGGDEEPYTEGNDHQLTTPTTLQPDTAAVAYRAVGLSQANFARITSDASTRADLHAKAIANLQQSLELATSDASCTETLYVLALLMAESRDLASAIHYVKRALARPQEAVTLASVDGVIANNDDEQDPDADDSYAKERKILPAWHLLVLLLCAREDFDVAATSCDAAFQQFGDAATLFGDRVNGAVSKQSLIQPGPAGLVDRMDAFEKQMLLEIKITHVSLLELSQGPEIAVNACNQLLALYARLFGKVDFTTSKAPKLNSTLVPSKSGTIRSKVSRRKPKLGFIDAFRAKGLRPGAYAPLAFPNTSAALASRPSTRSGLDPKSLYDKRNTVASSEKLNHHFSGKQFQSLEISQSGSLKKSAFGSLKSHRGEQPAVNGSENFNEKTYIDSRHSYDSSSPERLRSIDLPTRNDSLNFQNHGMPDNYQTLSHQLESVPEKLPLTKLPSSETNVRSIVDDIRSSTFSEAAQPIPQFAKLQERRHKLSLLAKVWLFTAGTYARASLFDDARQAIEEGNKLAVVLETEVAKKRGASVKNFQDRGWGGGQSVEDFWADVHTQRGKLYRTQELPHDALFEFEQALSFVPNHPLATVELCNILLDIYTEIVPSERPSPAADAFKLATLSTPTPSNPYAQIPPVQESNAEKAQTAASALRMTQPLPPELYRLVARDRAYGLLSSLTKLGEGWDNAEAWFTLARAYELSGQLEEAKKALWWTVELEDTRPVRRWKEVSPGGYVL